MKRKSVIKDQESIPESVTVSPVSAIAEEVAKAVDKAQTDKKEERREEAERIKAPGRTKMFRIMIPKQSNSDSNKPVFVPNPLGGKDWWLERGKEYTVPAVVVNILRESIQTSTEYNFETSSMGVKAVANVESVHRFSLQILGEHLL